jgi:WD40 repeat protein
LTQVSGSPFTTGHDPFSVAFSPSGRLLATSNETDATVSVFSVASNGALTQVNGSPFATGNGPFSVAFSPGGRLLANANSSGDNTVSVFSVASDGALTQVSGSPFATGSSPVSVAFSAGGGLLAIANAEDSTVSVFAAAPPTALIGSPTGGQTYALKQPVPTSFSCTDPYGPGISSCTDSNGSGSPGALDTATVGAHSYAVTATSLDGQTGTASTSYTVAGAPLATVSSPASAARYTRGRVVAASYACQDGAGGPGIASCIGPVATGQPINTTTVGRHTFTVTATSKDGQTTTSTITYTVELPNNHFTVLHIKTRRNGSITFTVKIPGPGAIDVLETAWNDNLARAAVLLQPAPGRFVFARAHRAAHQAGTLHVRVIPNARGKRLVHHHAYRVTLRLWVSYTPTGGKHQKQGFYGLHLPK